MCIGLLLWWLGSLLRWIFHMICTWMVMIFGPWLSGAFFKPLLTWSCCYYFLIQLPTWSFCYYFLIQLPICCCFLLGCFCRSCLLRLKRGDNFLIFVNICSFWYLTGSRPIFYLFLTQICSAPFVIIVCKPYTDRRHHRDIDGVHIIMGDEMRALSQSGEPRRMTCFVHAGVRG
jgi:hypothetical protein